MAMDEYFAKYNAERITNVIVPHIIGQQYVAPWGVVPVTLTAGGGAYNWGGYSADIIAALAIATMFMLHWAVVADADINGHYEIEFYYGATDILAAACAFTRTAPFTASVMVPVKSGVLPAGSRVRARMRHSVGGATALTKIYYHPH